MNHLSVRRALVGAALLWMAVGMDISAMIFHRGGFARDASLADRAIGWAAFASLVVFALWASRAVLHAAERRAAITRPVV